jgi:hypothetical protein
MSKPPIASEPEMKTPTVKLEPTVRGPIVGELAGQVVDVDGKTMQTSPVPGEA